MTNRLAASTSPYLRQHADNPVDWHEWGEDALTLARAGDKPILLSIGYSACHWCHVMAHESFEDAATAAVMNELFVNIKVDREERPDLDKIYQLAHQALTGRGGGWPLTVFITPDDLMAFYAGTYFPPEPRHGMPPFTYVLQQVRAFWDTRRNEVREQNASLAAFLGERQNSQAHSAALDASPIRRGLTLFAQHFDDANGGHAGAPKFPHCGELDLLREAQVDVPHVARRNAMARTTLDAMVRRGLYDHLGGGFFRYCVDARWAIPHFEKMLYDNAQLLPLYADAAVRFAEPRYATAVMETVSWLQREMRAPGGALFATLDADSEGEEGKFYVWQRDEVRALLGDADFAVAERHFGLDRPPNFEHHAWHLHHAEEAGEIARLLGRPVDAVEAALQHARTRLLAERDTRVRPGRDDKILTAWNALLASGLLRAARSLQREELAEFADGILQFIRNQLWLDRRLFACHAGGRAQFPAYLDDHAFLLDALIEQLQWRWDQATLAWTRELADTLLARFEDGEHGGFYFTAHDHETLPHRPRPFLDESLPSGNGVAARGLQRLGHLLGEMRYLDAAERTLRAAWPALLELPQGCATLLRTLNDALAPRAHLVVRAPTAEFPRWRAVLDPVRDARVDAYFIDSAIATPAAIPSSSASLPQAAWLCIGTQCLAPLATPEALREQLQRSLPLL